MRRIPIVPRLVRRRCRSRYVATASSPVNGVPYKVPRPGDAAVVGICLDGGSEAYFDAAAAVMPSMRKWRQTQPQHSLASSGYGLVASAMPSYTNPNNVSIVTGTTPNVHGICGNYFFDEETGEETMMNESKFLRASTIFAEMQRADVKVIICTTKHKLLQLLSSGLDPARSIFLSTEHADDDSTSAMLQQHGVDRGLAELVGRPAPDIYEPDASIHCLETGVRLLEHHHRTQRDQPVMMYLSTSDYVQHKFAPDAPEAVSFMGCVDRQLSALDELEAVVGITADHGMNDKTGFNGEPAVVYLEDILNDVQCPGRVILPITDPYVVHHGGLGGFATIHLNDKASWTVVSARLRQVPGVYAVMGHDDACRALDLPTDRIGDLVVVGDENTVLGRSKDAHDLKYAKNLRSHGSFQETMVPMAFNRRLNEEYGKRLHSGQARNFHLFDFLCNGVVSTSE